MTAHKILLIHHCKDFHSNSVYLSDQYLVANRKLFGAQELDTWAGFRMLSQHFEVYRMQISINLGRLQLLLPSNEVAFEGDFHFPGIFSGFLSPNYLKVLNEYKDTSIAKFCDEHVRKLICDIVEGFKIDIVWSDTQFYDWLIPTWIPTIIRSVNYEPIHVLREDPSIFRFIRYLSKRHSERKVLRNREVIAISPNDAVNYALLVKKMINVIPLRQLPYLIEQRDTLKLPLDRAFLNQKYFHFSGSTFDVKHNRDNLKQILFQIAPAISKKYPDIRILIFGHRMPESWKMPSNVTYMRFREDFYSYALNSLGAIVPSRGGAGMQAKIFEPLSLGIPLISHEDATAGYPFVPGKHFWNGSNIDEILDSISSILANPERVSEVVATSRSLARTLFDRKSVEAQSTSYVRNLLP